MIKVAGIGISSAFIYLMKVRAPCFHLLPPWPSQALGTEAAITAICQWNDTSNTVFETVSAASDATEPAAAVEVSKGQVTIPRERQPAELIMSTGK